MMNVDKPQTFYSNLFDEENDDLNVEGQERIADYRSTMDRFRRFIREFSTGGFNYKYREQLKKNYDMGEYYLEIDFDDLKQFDEESAIKLKTSPAQYISALETAAKEIADLITSPRSEDEKEVQDIHVIVTLNDESTTIRKIKSTDVAKLVKISGIIVAASQVRARATKVTLQCRTCRHTMSNVEVKSGLEGFQLPRVCSANQAGKNARCPMDPYFIVPDKCICTDYQTLKLQESPEDVPHGEMPRHMQLYVDRYLTDRVVPGNRVTVTGIMSIKRLIKSKNGKVDKAMSGIRIPYLKVTGIQIEMTGSGRADQWHFSPEDERKFRELAKRPDVYEVITKSIAPSIYGSEDIKKSIACLLFGGSRKRLPDGLTRRGDINVLLLGDPGTAKSQLLKFVEKVSPIAVYTSGKGSSAAGLTASIIRDPQSRSFIMEGGAMVLADGGVVCIDEFDKMREDDRVAIHEAMEQQTISIAKAGITTTLNSRCSVLAAANSVFGRWDDNKGEENIDFMPTILSRFDAIFVVKDTHDTVRDATLAKHVIAVHMNADQHVRQEDVDGELSLEFLKKFISYARATCAPRLCDAAKEKLLNNYVRMRNPESDDNHKKSRRMPMIPITVRQLEAVIRMSEALAKMELQPFALERHVDEALRIFRVSTLAAAESGQLAGIEGFMSNQDQTIFNRIENQLKKRFAIGTYVSEELIVNEFMKQGYEESMVKKVIQFSVRRGLLVYKYQRKMLYRVK